VEWVKRDEGDPGFEDRLRAVLATVELPAPARGPVDEAVSCWRRKDLDGAEKALHELIASTRGDPRALAQFLSADLFGFRGDLEDALLMPRLAAACGHREIAPAAAFRLGEELEECGDIGSAKRAYRQAIDSGRGRFAFRARLRLSMLLYREGDMRSAEESARGVLDADIPELAGWAAGYLADIRFSRGDREGAYSAFRQAAELDAGEAGDRATAEDPDAVGTAASGRWSVSGVSPVARS
jgi:tetratricopeptide (TPR) repeat protein